ncbi:unnamed protein product, partial [Choristocarpus tenellus]
GAVSQKPGDVQPWWIRYALVMFQEERTFDSLAYLRRLQSKFGEENEVKAALTAVYFGKGELGPAKDTWLSIPSEARKAYESETYLKGQLKWPPRVSTEIHTLDNVTLNTM